MTHKQWFNNVLHLHSVHEEGAERCIFKVCIHIKWLHGTKSATLDGKKAWHPPLGHRRQKKVKLDRLEFLCVRIYYIPLPSTMVDFVPLDQLMQKAYLSLSGRTT